LLPSQFWPIPSMSRRVINCAKLCLSHPFDRIKWIRQWAVDRDPVLTSTTSAKIRKTAILRARFAGANYAWKPLVEALPDPHLYPRRFADALYRAGGGVPQSVVCSADVFSESRGVAVARFGSHMALPWISCQCQCETKMRRREDNGGRTTAQRRRAFG